MPVNLEIKIKVISHDRFRKALKTIGAEYKGILNQKDIYYRVKNSLLKLRIQDNNIELIKYNRDESGKTRWSSYEIINLSGKSPEAYFRSIFNIDTVVTKKRELWLYNNTRIHLDTVRNLGKFLELEAIVNSGKRDAQKRFDFIINNLGIDPLSQVRTSYRNLTLKHKKK